MLDRCASGNDPYTQSRVGRSGGEPCGRAVRFKVNGKDAARAIKMTMAPDGFVVLETPGGGYGPGEAAE